MIERNIEILSPVGDFECLKAAVQNGANSVYLGASEFNARYSATNFDIKELEKAIIYAKSRGVKVHLALNILIKNDEFMEAIELAKIAYELGVDAIIVQDLGLAVTLIEIFPDLPIHASTQMTIHNLEEVKLLEKLGFKRVVLSRELSLEEIEYICKNSNIEIETFIHGALCVSYSGQCLLSSIIGGRSGNRGKCAGTCRLPYELVNEDKTLDSGYLLSTRDLCGLEYLPNLVKSGVQCFKIEGRMKKPEYVATVTRIYRKYLDKILNNDEYKIEKQDIKDLMQVFNRGGFSSGYLENKPNTNLVFKEKPNHIGIFLGKILKYNSKKGYITLKLENSLALGDKIIIDNKGISNNYNISELMKNNQNIKETRKGDIVTIGRMKGKIFIGDKIFLSESKKLTDLSTNSYQNVENIKINLECDIKIKENKRVEVIAKILNGDFADIDYEIITEIIPEKAQSAPISKEKIIEQFNKTKNTYFYFKNINIDLDENLFLTIASINSLRRNILEGLEKKIEEKIKRKSNIELLKKEYEKLLNTNKKEEKDNINVSLLLNEINENFDYSNLKNINDIYVPFKFFLNPKYYNKINQLSKFNLYIYLPVIMKNNYIKLFKTNINTILSKFKIKGIIISNIGQIELFDFQKLNLYLIGNYTLNAINNISIKFLNNIGIKRIILSPELNDIEIKELTKNCNAELMVYGRIPVMNTNYCVLGKSNKCYKSCKKLCTSNEKYYLKDRLNFKFRVIPDNIETVSTIYNSKITSIKWKEYNVKNLEIDIIDETIEEINNIINNILKNNRQEGKEYTNGNTNKSI